MFLVIGLGNPGAQYEWTRHNLGFMLVDLLAREAGAQLRRLECRALIGATELEGERVELVKPQTYMNLSGESVSCLLSKEGRKGALKGLIVISDDLALPFGTIRLRARGSAGGHNGLKSIIAALKSEEFARLRIGIKPEHPVNDTRRYVLEEFPKREREEVEKVLARGAEALGVVIKDGIEKAMQQYNSSDR